MTTDTKAAQAKADQAARAEQPKADTDALEAAKVAAAAAKTEVDEEIVAEEIAGEVDPAIADLNAGLVAMTHPDGGTCDAYETDADGNMLVPASEIASMLDHGFITAVAHAACED